MAKIKHSNGIEVEGYSSLAEYTFPQRPEYLILIILRMKLLEVKSLQEAYDYVQDEIVKIEKQELLKEYKKTMKIDMVEKRLEGTSDGSTAKELMKLAEKDPMTNIELELMNALERAFEEAKENGFKGSMEDYVRIAPLEELKAIGLAEGGDVDFTNMSPGQMKAIFISENGYEPKSPKELVRGVKMYLKNMDIKGVPFGVFDE